MMDLERENTSAAHWPKELYESVFANPESIHAFHRLAWVVEDDGEAFLQACERVPKILAFLVARRVDTDWELENIVVAEAFRRRGAGTGLLTEFVAQARTQRGSGIFLEVRESNHVARTLYRKAGFEETDIRKGYYANPREDAILCRLSLSGEF
jgi:[ribosomal protein S18]-alanine N-acetyltransferase